MRIRALLVAASPALLLLLPVAAHATGIPYWGPIIPNGEIQTCAAGWGAVIQVLNNVIAFGITIAIGVAAPLMIAYAGFLYVTNALNPSGLGQAKTVLMHTFTGIVIALAGYLIVDATLTALTTKNIAEWTSGVFTTSGECLQVASSLNQAAPTANGGGGLTSSSPGSTGGTCATPSSGPCSVSNLQNSCFGANAQQAAEICMNESAGNPASQSGVDKTSDGHSYSVGLFQTNLSNSFSPQVDGQSCAAAFSQPCQNSGGYHNVASNGTCSSTIINPQLYNDCVAAAQNAQTGVTVGCSLSNSGTNWGRWQNTEQGLQAKGCTGF